MGNHRNSHSHFPAIKSFLPTHKVITIIHINSPSLYFNHSANKGCFKGTMSIGVLWGLVLVWSLPEFPKHEYPCELFFTTHTFFLSNFCELAFAYLVFGASILVSGFLGYILLFESIGSTNIILNPYFKFYFTKHFNSPE